jgi:hypothetical protein
MDDARRDVKLPIAIFIILATLISIPFLIDHIRELRRPLILEARVVTASQSDPVFRDGRRRAKEDEEVEAAIALRVGRRGSAGAWIAPVHQLALDGKKVEHRESDHWPERDRSARVFWFSVESANLGGSLTAENAAEKLRYRTFLAPEMGRSLRAERLPESHNDDYIGEQLVSAPEGAGTIRLYARVEVVASDSDLRPLQAVTTRTFDTIPDADFPTILRSANFGEPIHASVGELFGLPGFEPRSDTEDWNDITVPAFQKSFADLVSDRLVVSSRTLAAVAIVGEPIMEEGALASLGTLSITAERVHRRGRALHWHDDVLVGDLLADGNHWWVLLGDNGNGDLDPADPVLHCWGRPPERTTLLASLETAETTVELLRHVD